MDTLIYYMKLWQVPPARAVSSLADFYTLKMKAIRSSETSVHTRSTRRHIPEDGILHSHRCENHKSYNLWHCYIISTSEIRTRNPRCPRLCCHGNSSAYYKMCKMLNSWHSFIVEGGPNIRDSVMLRFVHTSIHANNQLRGHIVIWSA
jgi:hypothetical protein